MRATRPNLPALLRHVLATVMARHPTVPPGCDVAAFRVAAAKLYDRVHSRRRVATPLLADVLALAEAAEASGVTPLSRLSGPGRRELRRILAHARRTLLARP